MWLEQRAQLSPGGDEVERQGLDEAPEAMLRSLDRIVCVSWKPLDSFKQRNDTIDMFF